MQTKYAVRITPRQTKIVGLKAMGFSVKVIADHLEIDDQTVTNILYRLRKRYDCKNTTALCCKLIERTNRGSFLLMDKLL